VQRRAEILAQIEGSVAGLTVFVGLLFTTRLVALRIGDFHTDFLNSGTFAVMIGMFCGVGEQGLSAVVARRASEFVSALGGAKAAVRPRAAGGSRRPSPRSRARPGRSRGRGPAGGPAAATRPREAPRPPRHSRPAKKKRPAAKGGARCRTDVPPDQTKVKSDAVRCSAARSSTLWMFDRWAKVSA
jgi:hypothetical protein